MHTDHSFSREALLFFHLVLSAQEQPAMKRNIVNVTYVNSLLDLQRVQRIIYRRRLLHTGESNASLRWLVRLLEEICGTSDIRDTISENILTLSSKPPHLSPTVTIFPTATLATAIVSANSSDAALGTATGVEASSIVGLFSPSTSIRKLTEVESVRVVPLPPISERR